MSEIPYKGEAGSHDSLLSGTLNSLSTLAFREIDPSLPSPHAISSEQREQETGKKIMKATFERFPISAPTCKELVSHHFHLHNRKKAELKINNIS